MSVRQCRTCARKAGYDPRPASQPRLRQRLHQHQDQVIHAVQYSEIHHTKVQHRAGTVTSVMQVLQKKISPLLPAIEPQPREPLHLCPPTHTHTTPTHPTPPKSLLSARTCVDDCNVIVPPG
jgi:hypothetical protein